MSNNTIKIFRSTKKLDETNIWNQKINEHLMRYKTPPIYPSLVTCKVNIVDKITVKKLLEQLMHNTNFVRDDE